MTALHVTASALATGGEIHVGWAHEEDRISDGPGVTVDAAIVVQEWPDVDLAAIEVPSVTYRAMSWLTTEVASVLTPVRTVGYPFGFDVEERSLTQRAFAGTVCSSRMSRLGRRDGHQTPIYEMSFAAPRGLSGAALCDP